MKKIISFGIWGTDPLYTVGMIRNIDLAKEIYPGWICRIYCASSVPQDIIEQIKERDNQEIVFMPEEGNNTSMFWRFYAAEDADIMLSRDSDSRLTLREKYAVDEWLASDKMFHIMRDNPQHGTQILGGMWGVRGGILKNIKEMINNYKKWDQKGVDQYFLRDAVFPIVVNTSFAHDEYFNFPGFKKEFPTKRLGENEYVGKIEEP